MEVNGIRICMVASSNIDLVFVFTRRNTETGLESLVNDDRIFIFGWIIPPCVY